MTGVGGVRASLRDAVRESALEVPASYAWALLRGQWPDAPAAALESFRTRRPRTFGEKVRYKMARDRRPLLQTMADKVAVRDYVASRGAGRYLLPLHATGASSGDIPWSGLPREYACKVSHACGGVIIVSESADPTVPLPDAARYRRWSRHLVHPNQAGPERIAPLVDRWLSLSYRQGPVGRREWAYHAIVPRVLVEEFVPADQAVPPDLKVLCIAGEPRMLSVIRRTRSMELESITRFLVEEAEQARAAVGLDPDAWADLLKATRALSTKTDMVRVDWLLGPDGPYFGELTSYPSGGDPEFEGHASLPAAAIDAILARQWTVPASYQ